MSKYDFELEMDTVNALKLIDDLITPDTDILEFGCANGRLTEHLSTIKNCKVTIVEIDQEAGEMASKYAVESFIGPELGDIEKYTWAKALESKFDYIIFADVLEHLYHPEMALEKCKSFLKPGGSILVSLPNIAHNSVIIELINNRFNYQKTGLLDDTHIRFFTYDSFKNMLDIINLKIVKKFATYSSVGNNELANNYNEIDGYMARALKGRPYGNVYQYIYEIKDDNWSNDLTIENHILEYQYCDYEVSIRITENEREKIEEVRPIIKTYIPFKGKDNLIEISFENSQYINKLRIDPIESNCVLEIEYIKLFYKDEEIKLPISITNKDYQVGDIYFFTTNDPQIYFEEVNKYADKIKVQFKIIEYQVFNQIKYEILRDELEARRILIEQKENYIYEQRGVIEQKENYIYEQRGVIEQKENYIYGQKEIMEEKQRELDQIKSGRCYKMCNLIKPLLRGELR